MINSTKHTDVTRSSRHLKRAGALLTGAVVVLWAANSVLGDDAPAAPEPTTKPSMVIDGLGADGSLRLTSGKSSIVNFKKRVRAISVGNPDVLDYNVLNPTSVLFTAKKPGTTAAVVFDEDNRSSVIDVTVDPDLALLLRQLKIAYPNLNINVTPLNDTISLRGVVPSMSVAEQVVEIASTYAKVHNFLEIGGGQQVMLQVRFAEVSKSALRNLGVTFGGTDGVSTFSTNALSGGVNTFTFPAPTGGSPLSYVTNSATSLFGTGRFKTTTFDYLISALRTNSLLRDLAEPNLIAYSGSEASFMAGGEVAVPVPQPGNGGSTITIEYHEFGVKLKFTPNVLGNGKIRLHCAPEVSEVDPSLGATVSGNVVPGFTKRTLETTAELSDGQSLALGGLLQDNTTSAVTKIPGLGDVPVLGVLFRSTSYQRNETELVVLVTPRLVAPMNPDEVPLLPGEHWRYPTELGQYIRADLGGPMVQPSKARADKKSIGMPPQFHGSYGFTAAGTGSVQATSPAK
jgi:pilus assembly protein CpaC